jgi:hypothetical protein
VRSITGPYLAVLGRALSRSAASSASAAGDETRARAADRDPERYRRRDRQLREGAESHLPGRAGHRLEQHHRIAAWPRGRTGYQGSMDTGLRGVVDHGQEGQPDGIGSGHDLEANPGRGAANLIAVRDLSRCRTPGRDGLTV